MMYVRALIKKIRYVVERLSSRPRIGGVHVSDSVLYFAMSAPEERSQSLRIPPGVLREGKVADRERFLEILTQFREMVGGDERRPVPVVVTLPAGLVYTQSFTVPNTGSSSLREAAELNMQMLSPLPKEQAYLGWQLIRETPDHYELLGAFAEKAPVDEIRTALVAARFQPVAIEFPSLSLARVVQEVYHSSPHPMLVLNLSSDGVNLFIFWNGALYFDYFRSWYSIQGDAREIPRERFDAVIVQEVQKVVNFSLSRFQEMPSEVFLVAPGFEAELHLIFAEQLKLRTVPIELTGSAFMPPWYPALGAALRGELDRSRDRQISLAPVSSADLFFREQLIDFIQLWRGITVAVLGLFLVFFMSVSSLLSTQAQSLESQLDLFSDQHQVAQLSELRGVAGRFNELVRTIGSVRTEVNPVPYLFRFITDLGVANRITVLSFNFSGFGFPVALVGGAATYDMVAAFKNVLESTNGVSNISLPLAQIAQQEDGSVVFALSFQFTPVTSAQ